MSTGIRIPKDQLLAIRLEDAQLYLASRGWRVEANRSNDLAVLYRLPRVADAEVLVPRVKDLADYAQRMADVLLMLSAVESRSATEIRTVWDILNDLSGPPADVLRIGISGPTATLGSIPLDQGLEVLKRGRELLNAAACHVHLPQSYYSKMYFKETDAFLASCKLGQTERNGAFIAKIAAPVPQNGWDAK